MAQTYKKLGISLSNHEGFKNLHGFGKAVFMCSL